MGFEQGLTDTPVEGPAEASGDSRARPTVLLMAQLSGRGGHRGVSIEELSRQGRWKSKAVEVYVWLREKDAGQATKDFGKGLEQADLVSAQTIQQHQPTVPLVPYDKRH